MLEPIPGPPGYPIVGNLFDLRDEIPINGFANLADKYGPIYKVNVFNTTLVVVSNAKLLEELCDEKRFHKAVSAGLMKTRGSGPFGLFVSPSEKDPDWGQAHRVLMPAFGPLPIQDMFDEMYDIAVQLVLKWARKGPEYRIPATDDFTRLTLDTIALCAMDYRFNSFYQDDMHPFVKAMITTLSAGNNPSSVLGILQKLTGTRAQEVEESRKLMGETAKQLVQYRRDHPSEKKDLLNAMLKNKDPKTGEYMRDELISANMVTFLIAGHETTSGLLSFAFVEILKNPAAYRAAREEVDRVVGQGKIKYTHLKDLKYIDAVLKETIRLHPTAPAFARQLREENDEPQPSLGGYALDPKWKVLALLPKLQQDPKVYGEDASEFVPERMLDGKFERLPKGAWKAFGTGERACIGRPFAWQEAMLVTAITLQHFDLKLDDPSYELQIKQTLTIKPKDFFMRASPRKGMTATSLPQMMMANDGVAPANKIQIDRKAEATSNAKEILILYGSNTGTCQALAQRLADDAEQHGLKGKVMDMDSGIQRIQQSTIALIVTASYEGEPPDNAVHFVQWLESLGQDASLEKLNFAVFGCGHRDWATTFQKVPTLVDEKLSALRAKRIVPRGFADVAQGDPFGDFDKWSDESLWPAMKVFSPDQASKTGQRVPHLEVEIRPSDRATQLRQDVEQGVVRDVKVLTASGEPQKCHMEILLPTDMAYQPGDYLAVLPLNPEPSVQRVMTRYHFPWDATAVIKSHGSSNLPKDTPVSVTNLLKGYVELAQPATKKDIRLLEDMASGDATRQELKALGNEQFNDVTSKRISVLDILSKFDDIDLPFEELLSMLPPMRTRHYSISSSPLANPKHCTITYGVIEAPSHSGEGQFHGVAGTYLKSLKPGDPIQVSVRPANKAFRLPLQADRTPIMMFGAGTGLAPFRGFIQQRSEMIKAGNKALAPAILFAGCRSHTKDRLYADEVDEWIGQGAVNVKYAFSKESDHPSAEGCSYVQDRMVKDRHDIYDMWDKGVKIYTCGTPTLAKSVREAAHHIVRKRLEEKGVADMEEEKLDEWFRSQKGERFATDVFA